MNVRSKILLLMACFIAFVFLAAAPSPSSAPAPEPGPAPTAIPSPPAPPAPSAVSGYEIVVVADRSGDEEINEHEGVVAPRADANMFFFGASGSWLGVTIADIDEERASELGLRDVAGVEVQAVLPESPAEKAGLKKGDVILTFQDTAVQGVAQLTRLVRETPAGRKVRLELFRDGSAQTVEAEIEKRGGSHDFHRMVRKIEIPHIEIPNIHVPDIDIDIPHILENVFSSMHGTVLLGVAVESLDGQLKEFFGVEGEAGVLVRSVKEDSAAAEAGVRAGDVILKIDDQEIDGPGALRRALRERKGQTVEITVMRERRERTLTATLPEETMGSSESRWEWKSAPHEGTERIREQVDRIRSMQHQLRGEARRLRDLERQMRRQSYRMQRDRHRIERERERNRLRELNRGSTIAI